MAAANPRFGDSTKTLALKYGRMRSRANMALDQSVVAVQFLSKVSHSAAAML